MEEEVITIKNKYTGQVILEIETLATANLSNADLRDANLRYADLSNADLRDANLRYADLSDADLSNANLSNANLRYANLSNANLSNANLRWCIGNMREIKSAQFDTYMITWSKDTLAIGCQQHPIETWWSFDDDTIAKMDQGALLWWKKWKPVLQQIIEMSA